MANVYDECVLTGRMYRDLGIRFISNKWFINDNEVKADANLFNRLLFTLSGVNTLSKVNNLKEAFIALYGEEGPYPELPLWVKAKSLLQANKGLKRPLPLPLNNQQLKIINYLMRNDDEIAIILTGVGGSGKSTFLNIIKQLFNNDYASLNLSDLSNRFKLATAVGHRLVCSDEINSEDLNNGTLKTLISHQPITVDPKFGSPYQTSINSAFIFSSNIPPRLNLSDSGMLRRFLYYGMNKKIENPDLTLNKRTFTEDELIDIIINALQIDMTDWKKDFEKDTRYYMLKYNSVYIIKEYNNYALYREACFKKGLKPFSEVNWKDIVDLIDEWGLSKEVEKEEDLFLKGVNPF